MKLLIAHIVRLFAGLNCVGWTLALFYVGLNAEKSKFIISALVVSLLLGVLSAGYFRLSSKSDKDRLISLRFKDGSVLTVWDC